jgi:rhodanese-related sulfurtransferase
MRTIIKQPNEGSMQKIFEPGEPFERISVDQAKDMIERGGVQIVDCRQPAEYMEAHLTNSLLIPLDDLFERAAELDHDCPIIFVCAVGVRSAVACETAAALGRTKLYNMEGGIQDWIKKGYPVERTIP